ncbi:MAG: alkaline phosphatase, partial [Myxococcota bacterium]
MRGLSSLVLCSLIAGCTPKQVDAVPTLSAGQPGVAAAPKRPKNVILIIGDGMGPQQIGLLELYARRAPSAPYKGRATSFQRLADKGVVGLSMHYPDRYLITDSACSATQLALGVPAPVEALGVDGNGVPQTTVLERAQAAGLSTGLVSDTRLTHATPAAFAAHVPQRSMENEVASQVLETGPDVMLSGGWRHFVAATEEGSKRTDERDLLQEARQQGYTVARTAAEMDAAGDGKLLGLFAPSGMMGAI